VVIETWQDAIGVRCVVKGYPNIVLRIKHIHVDFDKPQAYDDLRPGWGGATPKPASCVCEVVYGTPPESWEPCTPYGHYRVVAKDLILEGEEHV